MKFAFNQRTTRVKAAQLFLEIIGNLLSGTRTVVSAFNNFKSSAGNWISAWNGALTAQRYRDDILRPIVVPYAAAIGDESILMEDNARPHRAELVDNFLFDEGIFRMDWPAYSPDLNPIEHV
ncbi:hypothetical protein AVEN_129147-1 [Araneus ventricosus]|uniref:Tc1-like transposase DDE domain-containing protein n=1 Tax=Araneus ventricosus TaxID=182803 RepID=A0A4Y2NB28_ARAVE|nr:hypothetical protein AVEN_129147-1 [Araneus ventricosus]